MSLIVWTNNASSTLASGITNIATQLTVQAGQGALYPNPSAGQYAMVTIEDVSGNIEIVKCTGRTGDTLTIVRAQEGTAGIAFASGSRVECRVTAGILATLLQHTGDTLSDVTISGIVTMGGGGSIRGGEWVGGFMRGAAGDTSNQLFVPSGGGAPTIGGSPILTKANLLSQLPAGSALLLTNMVLYWNGTTGTIPTGFALCDGTAGTPDLRDLFILGGAGILPSSGGSATTVTGATSALGSTNTGAYALTTADIPAHTHNLLTTAKVLAGGAFPVNHPDGVGSTIIATAANTGGGGAHAHTLGSSSHTHTYALPPYRAMLAIMKT